MSASSDRVVLRDLAQRVAEAAALPVQVEKARLWRCLNALHPERPMVLADPQGGWRELVPETALQCQDLALRTLELGLRFKLYRHEHIHDDYPITATLGVHWAISIGDYGLQQTETRSEERGSYHWDPPVKSEADWDRIHPRQITIDRPATLARLAQARDLLGDILQVQLVGESVCRAKLTRDLIFLRGLEQLMLDIYDRPAFLHRMMAFMRDDKQREWELYEREGVLSLNNGPESIMGSGGICHTADLPAADFAGQVRMQDMWCWGEAQETVGVGPDQFSEFVLQYQLPLLNCFGLVDYGCCEPLDRRFDLLLSHIPRLRSVAVSPWCNRREAAEKLANRYVYVYKPNPSRICSPRPDWEAAEQEIRETLDIARGCCVSLVMKDTHTFMDDPGRVTRWADMAMHLAQEASD
jgi:hypothetical protein